MSDDDSAKPSLITSDEEQDNSERDGSFYFDDGSVVLSAPKDPDEKDNTKLIYFRVHMSLLAKESTIFADMMKIPTPPELEKAIYDGAPLVAMQDRASRLRGFLRAIYEPHEVFLRRYADDTAKALVGPLILADKYEATALKERIIRHINTDWPHDDYRQWKAREEELSRVFSVRPNPERLIDLSWAADVREELRQPVSLAYFALSCEPVETYLTECLDADDFIIMLVGRRDMEAWFKDHIANGTGTPPLPCCAQCRPTVFKDTLLLKAAKSANLDFLAAWEERANSVENGHCEGVCPSKKCRKGVANWLRGLTAEAYRNIPDFFTEPKVDIDE